MPTPIGHALVGLAVFAQLKPPQYRFSFLTIVLIAFASVFPDLDFIPGFIVGEPNKFHRDISHSVGFLGLLLIIIFSFERFILKKDKATFSLWFFIFFSLHIITDYFSADTRLPFGQPIFWPISENYYMSKFSIFLDIQRSPALNEFIPSLFSKHNFTAIFIEVIFALGFGSVLFLGKKIVLNNQELFKK